MSADPERLERLRGELLQPTPEFGTGDVAFLLDELNTAEDTSRLIDALDSEVTRLWEALFWISEWPNRHAGRLAAADNDAVILAEYAREALDGAATDDRSAVVSEKDTL